MDPGAPPLTQYKPRRFQAFKPWTIASPTTRGIREFRLGLFLVPYPVVVRQLGLGIGSHDAHFHALRNVAWGFVAELWRRLIVRIAYGGIVNDQSPHEKWGPASL